MKKTLRHLRTLASIASFALFVYVMQRRGPEAVLRKVRTLFWAALGLLLAAEYSITRPAEEEGTT